MSEEKSIVITAYGHDRIIDKISISLLSDSKYNDSTDAKIYCNTINRLELKDDNWVFARTVSENTPYTTDSFLPYDFSELILKLEGKSLQKVMREVLTYDLHKALKNESDEVKNKVFKNMTKRASQIFKEEMEKMGEIGLSESKQAQYEIISIIRHLIDCGEILSPYSNE